MIFTLLKAKKSSSSRNILQISRCERKKRILQNEFIAALMFFSVMMMMEVENFLMIFKLSSVERKI
jgi:hypothetical protein